MRLFLSSYYFGEHAQSYANLFRAGKRVAIISSAQDVYTDQALREQKMQTAHTQLQAVGLQGAELDLRHYFGKSAQLRQDLTAFDGVWVRGGNAFVLRKAMHYSGFDVIIRELLAQDVLVYGGYSAGVCVLGTTMRGLEYCDEADAVPDGYASEIIWDGVGVLPYTIVPHYQSAHPESADIDVVVEHLRADETLYRTLHDGEAMLIDGEKEVLLT